MNGETGIVCMHMEEHIYSYAGYSLHQLRQPQPREQNCFGEAKHMTMTANAIRPQRFFFFFFFSPLCIGLLGFLTTKVDDSFVNYISESQLYNIKLRRNEYAIQRRIHESSVERRYVIPLGGAEKSFVSLYVLDSDMYVVFFFKSFRLINRPGGARVTHAALLTMSFLPNLIIV